MFVQIIEGKVADAAALRRQFDRWNDELRPGAGGFLGSTTGVTDDGHGFALARFASAAEAQANSDRPEQGQWWAETEKCFDGEVSFTDSEDVETYQDGGSDDSHFVQVMKGRADRAALSAVDRAFEEHGPTFRPDLLGVLRVWTGTDSYVEVAYFTNEAEARAGEAKEPPAALRDQMAEFEELMAGVEYLDLKDPWLL